MEQIKKHDFVEIEYTGKLKEENIVFDTTDEVYHVPAFKQQFTLFLMSVIVILIALIGGYMLFIRKKWTEEE